MRSPKSMNDAHPSTEKHHCGRIDWILSHGAGGSKQNFYLQHWILNSPVKIALITVILKPVFVTFKKGMNNYFL